MATRNKILHILITARDAEAMRALLREHPLDVACGGPQRRADGTIAVEAYVPEDETDRLQKRGVEIQVLDDATATGRARQKEVGKGNRFAGDQRVPRGLGRKVKGDGDVIP